MLKLTSEQKLKYYEKSYKSVDGLWFMKTEEVIGFAKTLDIDAEVWKVMPKIQARQLKALVKTKDKTKAFLEAFQAKLAMDGFEFKVLKTSEADGILIEAASCPWVELLKRSGREHLADLIGNRICSTEYAVWADEFETGLAVEFQERICGGGKCCRMRFGRKKAPSATPVTGS